MIRQLLKKYICILICGIMVFMLGFSCLAAAEYTTWKQSDNRWGSISFGQVGDTVSKSGCAVTSIAILMVHSGAISSDPSVFNPGILVNFLNNNNGFTYDGAIYWAKPAEYTDKFSYKTSVTLSGSVSDKTATIKRYSDEGYVMVASVKNGGHYVAIDRVENGTVYMFDPARSGYTQLFEYDATGVTRIILYKGPTNGSQSSGGSTPDTPVDNPLGAEKSESGFYTGTYTVTSSDGINIRTGPSADYDKAGSAVPHGTTLTVSAVSGNWGKTTYGGATGWVCLDYAKRTSPIITAIKVKSLPSKLKFGLSEQFDPTGLKMLAVYDNGNETEFTGYTLSYDNFTAGENTVKVTYKSLSTSFSVTVYDDSPSNAPVENPLGAEKNESGFYTGTYVITSDTGVNIRKGPSLNDEKTGIAIPYGAEVEVKALSANWGKVTYNGTEGWFCLDYAMRISPVITSIKIGSLPAKTTFHVSEKLDFTGLKMLATYDNGSDFEFTGYTIDCGDLSLGENIVKVTYKSLSTSFKITIYDQRILGDVDGDHRVSSADALLSLQCAVEKISLDPTDKGFADVNKSGDVTASDALLILQYSVKKISSF